MNRVRGIGDGTTVASAKTVRVSISFLPDLYRTLEQFAKQKKVSLAWVVRDATGKYIADRSVEAH